MNRKAAALPSRTAVPFDVSTLQNTPRQRRSHALTLRVLCAAEKLIREFGYDGLTIAMVAKEANVSTGGLYGRFRSREEIVAAVNRQLLQRIDEESLTWIPEGAKTAEEMVSTFVAGLVQFFRDHGPLFPVNVPKDPQIVTDAANVEGTLRARMRDALMVCGRGMEKDQAASISAMIVHLTFASLLREVGTPGDVPGRQMTWPVLAAELPRVATSYLKTVMSEAKG